MNEYIASVNIDGKYYPLGVGKNKIGDIAFSIDIENRSDGLYSWIVNLENDSNEKSPRIREFFGIDTTVKVKGETVLNTLRGDDCTVRSFFPESFALCDGASIVREPFGGRSSNTTAFPYFDIKDESDRGLVFGIGWSGQWRMRAERLGDEVRITAGFADCDFILEPHESVRSVRILIYFGQGTTDELRHKFVNLHRKYYSPIPSIDDGFFPIAVQAFDRYYWGNAPKNGEIHYWENENTQYKLIDSASKCKHFNSFWIDACWFDGAFRSGVGNYNYSKGFSRGLRGFSDHARENGMRFILWFEPVRCHKETEVYNRFKDDKTKIVSVESQEAILVNIGDPEVWQYQFDNISRIIEENGVDIYRQDFNIDPYDHLKSIEAPDRIGISQIRFVEGLYRLWDALKARFPHLIIDNCASGGRLIDVETSLRAIPLWRSDMACRPSPLAMQNEVLCLSRYIPYHGGGSFDYTPYFMRSSMTVGVTCEFPFLDGFVDPVREENSLRAVSDPSFMISEITHHGMDYNAVSKQLEELLEIKEYWKGDFTALTLPSDRMDTVVAYTLSLTDEDRGIALVFRREEAPGSYVLKLPKLSRDAEYLLEIVDEDLFVTEKTVAGETLIDGFAVQLGRAPSSLLIKYRKKIS
jgi:alpha-galactosidase